MPGASVGDSTRKGLHLLCLVQGIHVAIPLSHVRETMRALPTTPLRDMPPFVRGLANIRGRPTPVVDVGCLLSGTQRLEPARYVSIQCAGRTVALAFDDVLGTSALTDGTYQELPPLLTGAAADAVEAVGHLDAALLVVLAAARVLPEEAWKTLEQAGAAA